VLNTSSLQQLGKSKGGLLTSPIPGNAWRVDITNASIPSCIRCVATRKWVGLFTLQHRTHNSYFQAQLLIDKRVGVGLASRVGNTPKSLYLGEYFSPKINFTL
jgi:hypothetical protein